MPWVWAPRFRQACRCDPRFGDRCARRSGIASGEARAGGAGSSSPFSSLGPASTGPPASGAVWSVVGGGASCGFRASAASAPGWSASSMSFGPAPHWGLSFGGRVGKGDTWGDGGSSADPGRASGCRGGTAEPAGAGPAEVTGEATLVAGPAGPAAASRFVRPGNVPRSSRSNGLVAGVHISRMTWR